VDLDREPAVAPPARPPAKMTPPAGRLVRVGRIGRVHGVRGELGLVGTQLTPGELQSIGRFVWRGPRGATLELALAGVRPVHGALLVSFSGYGDREAALALVRGELLAEAGRLPDPGPGVAYTFQLIGLTVRTEDGRVLGELADVISTGAHPIYVVKGARELLVPATAEVLKWVDLEARTITVALPPGLEEIA